VLEHAQPPSERVIRHVVGWLEARARLDSDVAEPSIRVGGHGDVDGHDAVYFLDLGDSTGRAVEIRATGWTIVDRPPVHFIRPADLLPLPVPTRDGSIDLLRPYVSLPETDFRLMITWLTTALRPFGPYPILSAHGEYGSAKTTLVNILRLLIDPQSAPVLGEPESALDLMVTALNGWLLVYDNVSSIPKWLSDGLCQLVYGAGIARRTLYQNTERSVIHAQRPVILAGIEEFVRRGDLRDRCVFLHLKPILPRGRRTEVEFWTAWRADYPRILGGVLDAMVGGLRELPSVHLDELPRMADHAVWGEAIGRALGWAPQSFIATYNENRKEATMTELEGSPLAMILLTLAPLFRPSWTGAPAELYGHIARQVGQRVVASSGWPKTIHSFGSELKRLAPHLRLHGLSITFERLAEGRIVTVVWHGK
jgi:hypothetical protein